MIKVRRTYFIFFLSFICIAFLSQVNLVPNPSFETYTACPTNFDQINYAVPWFRPTTGTTDYYNVCASASSYYNVPITGLGNCFANSGTAMAGLDLIDNIFGSFIYREYISVKLNSPLISGKRYYATYFARLADSARYATQQINVYFGDSIYRNNFDTIKVIPQIQNASTNFITSKTSWTKLRGSFIAAGGEKYICIGNFKHPLNGDTVFVNGGYKFNYTLSYYFMDDICVTDDSLYSENWITDIEKYSYKQVYFYPNPVQNFLFLSDFNQFNEFKLIDFIGNEVRFEVLKDKLDLSGLPPGIYFLSCKRGSEVYGYKVIKK